MLEVLDFAGWTVASQHDLFAGLVQGVEGMEELLLDAFLAREELDVINQEHIGLAVALPEPDELIVLNGIDEFIGEFFRRKVGDARSFLMRDNVLPDGVKQVRFAQPGAAVKEKRVVGFAWRLRHGHGGGVGEVIVAAHDKGVEDVFGIEGGFPDG